MFTDETEFADDTERLFRESHNNRLESKVAKVRVAIQTLFAAIEATDEIRVSYSVFEGMKQLAENDIRKYRGLRVLQEIKSSFVPSFADARTEESKV